MNNRSKKRLCRRSLRYEGLEQRMLMSITAGDLVTGLQTIEPNDPSIADEEIQYVDADQTGIEVAPDGGGQQFDEALIGGDFDGLPQWQLPSGPVPPSNLETTAQTRNSVTIRWRDNAATETHFRIYRSGPGPDGAYRTVATRDMEGTLGYQSFRDSISVSGTYRYWVRAVNGDGGSFASNTVTAVVPDLVVVPALNSLPGAPATLYLDFDGHFEPVWGGYRNADAPVFDIDGDATAFSDTELEHIAAIWARVAEDYAPFNINVSTVEPPELADGVPASVANGVALRVAIGGSGDGWTARSVSGLGYNSAFTDDTPNVCFVFSDNIWRVGGGNDRRIADVASQESGHSFGLKHQSRYDAAGVLLNTYHPGGTSWAPIMGAGAGGDMVRSIWYNGTTTSATTWQDDMAVLANSTNGFGYRPDDHSSFLGLATPLVLQGDQLVGDGVIERSDGTSSDADAFSFFTGGGWVDVDVRVARWDSTVIANLDTKVELRDAAGNVVASRNPSTTLDVDVHAQVAPGRYYVVVSSHNGYGAVGQYTVTVTPTTTLLVSTSKDELDADYSEGDLSLREALLLAADTLFEDTIRFDDGLTGRTITLDPSLGQLEIDSNVEVRGLGVDYLTVDAAGRSRVFHVADGVTASLSGLTITGGAISSEFDDGGGILNDGTLEITNAAITDNHVSVTRGGGINNRHILTIADTTISGNSAAQGGGIYNNGQYLQLIGVTISDNRASSGGGIYSQTINGQIVNSTISGNSADYYGGGIHYAEARGLPIIETTIAQNTAGVLGGGVYSESGTPPGVLLNTIVASNVAPFGPDAMGNFDSFGHNLISNVSGSSGWLSSDLVNRDPNLGPLKDNGGPTWTHALRSPSPAIDAGDNFGVPATDQRGMPRIMNGDLDISAIVDIGAFEFSPLAPLMFDWEGSGDGYWEQIDNTTDANQTTGNVSVESETSETLADATFTVDQLELADDATFAVEITDSGIGGLGDYVSRDGLTYENNTLVRTIDKDLHPADANLDGATDLSDFNIWNANKFNTGTDWTTADFNGDGNTDLSDFNIWNANKFTTAPAPPAVHDAVLEEAVMQGSENSLFGEAAWLHEFERTLSSGQKDNDGNRAEEAVDQLLATY